MTDQPTQPTGPDLSRATARMKALNQASATALELTAMIAAEWNAMDEVNKKLKAWEKAEADLGRTTLDFAQATPLWKANNCMIDVTAAQEAAEAAFLDVEAAWEKTMEVLRGVYAIEE